MKKYLIMVLIILAGSAYLYWADVPVEQNLNVDMLSPTPSHVDITQQDVAYFGDVKGFYARPAAPGSYPGIVMIHEWWGLNDNIKEMARNLAGQGYQVLAVDLYEGIVATTADEARQQTSNLNQGKALDNMRAAIAYLNDQDATKIGSLGWCFGGGQSMQLALAGEDLSATVIYYGNLVTDKEKLAGIKWPVLGIFGEEDTSIPVETVNEFDTSLALAGVEHQIFIYPGVGHAFANPSGANYAPEATMNAWQKTLDFLDKNLK